MEILTGILLYAIPGLAVLVVIHEFGHLILARLTGIGVEAYSVFFGRAIYKFQWRGIEWRLGWLPFGGYCKMKGQEDFGKAHSKGEKDEFYQRPTWARLLAILGGPLFNIILGFFLFIFVSYFQTERIIPNHSIVVNPQLESLLSLKTGDKILAIDGEKVSSWNDVQAFLTKRIHLPEQVFTIEREGRELEVVYQLSKEWRIRNEQGFQLPQLARIGQVAETLVVGEDANQNSIEKTAPAFEAKIKGGSWILSVNDAMILSSGEMIHEINRKPDASSTQIQLSLFEVPQTQMILRVDGLEINSKEDIKRLLQKKEQREYRFTLRDAQGLEMQETLALKTLSLEPLKVLEMNPVSGQIEERRKIGASIYGQLAPGILASSFEKEYSIPESFVRGLDRGWTTLALSINQFRLLSQLKAETTRENLAGPVGIVHLLAQTASERSLIDYIGFLALFSLFLGVFNLLPIPALDGGHVMLTLFEMARRKPLNPKFIERFQMVGVFIVISLAILITFNDITKFFR